VRTGSAASHEQLILLGEKPAHPVVFDRAGRFLSAISAHSLAGNGPGTWARESRSAVMILTRGCSPRASFSLDHQVAAEAARERQSKLDDVERKRTIAVSSLRADGCFRGRPGRRDQNRPKRGWAAMIGYERTRSRIGPAVVLLSDDPRGSSQDILPPTFRGETRTPTPNSGGVCKDGSRKWVLSRDRLALGGTPPMANPGGHRPRDDRHLGRGKALEFQSRHARGTSRGGGGQRGQEHVSWQHEAHEIRTAVNGVHRVAGLAGALPRSNG